MRTLRKSLSLVLALIMCLSLCSGAFATQNFEPYVDADEVGETYTEAVDFMIGSGIVEGYSADKLGATATLTREQVAKIIAVMKLGTKAADKLSASEDPFTDVAATRWSAGYIAYCVENGIIDGMGDGTFAPTAPVTGYQAGKMLLAAVGYGANDEFVGNSWAIQTARIAIPEGVYDDDLDAATHDPIQRQQFFLMAFNTFTAVPQVKFSALINDYVYVGDRLSGATGTTVDPTFLNNTYECAEGFVEYYPAGESYVIDGISVNGVDYSAAGRYGHVWYKTVKGEDIVITDVYFDDTLLGESYNGTTYAKLTNVKEKAFIAKEDADMDYILFFVNGTEVDEEEALALIAKKGNLVQFYDFDEDKDVDYVHVCAKTIAVVGNGGVKYDTKKEKATIAGIIPNATPVEDLAGFENLKKDDVVLYFEDAAGVTHFELAPTFLGQLSRTSYNQSELEFTISGKVYTISKINGACTTDDVTKQGYNKDVNYYTDDFGYIAYAKAVTEDLSDFVVLLGLDYEEGGAFAKETVYAKLLKMDGKTEIVKISKIDGEDVKFDGYGVSVGDFAYEETDVDFLFYSYKVISGKYQLSVVGGEGSKSWTQEIDYSAAADTVENNISKIVVNGEKFYANTSTVYLYPKYKTNGDIDSWKVATGLANAPTNEYGDIVTVAAKTSGSVAKFVFILGETDNSAKADAMFFVNTAYYGYIGAVEVNGVVDVEAHREYQAIDNGELAWVKVAEDVDFNNAKAGLYEPTYDEDGIITAVGPALSQKYTGIAGGASDDEVIIVGQDGETAGYTYTSATKVYVITLKASGDTKGFATMTEITADEIDDDDNDIVYVKESDSTELRAEEIYIIKVDNTL